MLDTSRSSSTAVEIWHFRIFVFSATATLALGVEVAYTKLVPRLPQLYAALIRAAVWDCVLVGVLVAQLVDLASIPLLAGIDTGHYLPLAVLLYHAIAFGFCGFYDLLSQQGSGRSRTWHRTLVSRRVLLELAGGPSGTKLYLGRICFIVSGGAMWLAIRVLLLLGEDTMVLTCFILLMFVSYCAAGLAALEPRRSLPGQLVQWLCTGWGAREALLQGPLKILGALLMLPFAASVIAAQIWLRTISFIVWLAVAWPCCRLQRADNVFDAFERELAIPLLQCSFLAFACTLAGLVLEAELSRQQRLAVGVAATYYTAMLLAWTAPAVLQAKVAAEESYDAHPVLGEEGSVQLLDPGDGVELEELRGTCDELKALLQRERHDHAVEVGRLVAKLRDQELVARAQGESGGASVRSFGGSPEAATSSPSAARANSKQALWPRGQDVAQESPAADGGDADARGRLASAAKAATSSPSAARATSKNASGPQGLDVAQESPPADAGEADARGRLASAAKAATSSPGAARATSKNASGQDVAQESPAADAGDADAHDRLASAAQATTSPDAARANSKHALGPSGQESPYADEDADAHDRLASAAQAATSIAQESLAADGGDADVAVEDGLAETAQAEAAAAQASSDAEASEVDRRPVDDQPAEISDSNHEERHAAGTDSSESEP
ncbi:unnamed protein product [Effrenium voratum]|uniref:Uncharacterized protein n=1 Tax=Effrenium voratum TaxID=2562239 RepID=A0AA36MSX7_9DINO|nr:unnamed protein product [Effrenium voratum]CAJ1457762.1 unnamed protein product [Effrenium voratum]